MFFQRQLFAVLVISTRRYWSILIPLMVLSTRRYLDIYISWCAFPTTTNWIYGTIEVKQLSWIIHVNIGTMFTSIPITSIREARSGNLDPGSSIREPCSWNLDPGSLIREPRSGNLEPWYGNLKPGTSIPACWWMRMIIRSFLLKQMLQYSVRDVGVPLRWIVS